MDFFDVIKKRRSVRKFTDQKVEATLINKALDAALIAPNSSNMQPWEFYWIQDPLKKQNLIEACFSQNAAKTAQELIFVIARLDTWKRNRKLILEWAHKLKSPPKVLFDYYQKLIPLAYSRDPFYIKDIFSYILTTLVGLFRPTPRTYFGRARQFEGASKSTALACENFMLVLVAQGLACCPMEGFDEKRVKKILKLNRHCHVVMGIGIGYAAEDGVYADQFRISRDLVVKKL
ncbi:MAG: nitroreductase family protein [Bdellovibrionales bacterium]|nr:nitroreductase family protein [Bdellovibrionales bacterium]